jgi:hypothetical protein
MIAQPGSCTWAGSHIILWQSLTKLNGCPTKNCMWAPSHTHIWVAGRHSVISLKISSVQFCLGRWSQKRERERDQNSISHYSHFQEITIFVSWDSCEGHIFLKAEWSHSPGITDLWWINSQIPNMNKNLSDCWGTTEVGIHTYTPAIPKFTFLYWWRETDLKNYNTTYIGKKKKTVLWNCRYNRFPCYYCSTPMGSMTIHFIMSGLYLSTRRMFQAVHYFLI